MVVHNDSCSAGNKPVVVDTPVVVARPGVGSCCYKPVVAVLYFAVVVY